MERDKTEIDNVEVYSLQQTYDDGRKEIFSIGDETDIGKIVSFEKKNDFWMALGDKPSEWQTKQGMKNSWSWILQLEKISLPK